MSRVVLDMSISLDGFVAGPNGEDGGLHDYFFNPDPQSAAVVAEGLRDTGAILMGWRTYALAASQDAFVDNPYAAAHFVVTRQAPSAPAKGAEAFAFVTDGLRSALRQARLAAGSRDVVIGGGAALAQQALAAGLVDDIQLHLVSVLLGAGPRLFDHGLHAPLASNQYRVVIGRGVTHLFYHLATAQSA